MADNNIPPENKKIGRRAKPATASKPVSNKDDTVSSSYDAQSYGIFKMRLTDQSSQIKRMTDYSEDSAIRLNDIYEILKTMRPVPYVSSLDTYFYENGYIPVKVINPCCDEESTTDNTANKDKNKDKDKDKPKSFKEYLADIIPAVVPALAYIASKFHPAEEEVTAPADAMSLPVDPRVSMSVGQLPAAISTQTVPTPAVTPNTVVAAKDPAVVGNNPSVSSAPLITTNPVIAPGSTATQSATRLPTITRVPPEPVTPRAITTTPSTPKLPSSLTRFLENPYARPPGSGGGRGALMNMPDLGMPGQGGVGGGKYPSVFGDEDSPVLENMSYRKPDNALGNYGITKDNTDNTILTARKINFVAKEITYEAGKFEFIDQSSNASSGSSGSYGGSMGGDLSTVSFNPQESAIPMNGGGSGAINNPSMGGVTYGDSGSAIAKIQEAGAGYNVVELADGTIEKRTGARNWRNNNPGNIEYGDFAIRRGAIGSDGRFAIFPNFETGEKAQESLLFEGKGYQGMTIAQAISRYAPPSENNTQAYINSVASAIGVSPNTLLSQLSSEQRDSMLKAMHQVEGFKRGEVDIIKPGTKLASNSDEFSPHADIASKSASTTLELNKPPAAPTVAPAVSSASIINVKSSAPPVDEPWAAFHDMFDMLDDATLARNPWV